MTLEICAYSLQSALTAQRAGAGRIELCGGQAEGGTTPSAGLIRLVKEHVRIPVYVMIRPRGGDFVYDEHELAVMRADIDVARSLSADGVVLGALRPDGTVDEAMTTALIEYSKPLPVTFHRAFDLTRDPHEALDAVIRCGAERILTSGQQATAEAGATLLRSLVKQAGDNIEIMAGAGVNAQNATLLAETGVQALHLSGSLRSDSPMQFRRAGVPMGTAVPNEYERSEADEEKIRAVIEQLRSNSGRPQRRTV